jgi:hypothetical protein
MVSVTWTLQTAQPHATASSYPIYTTGVAEVQSLNGTSWDNVALE